MKKCASRVSKQTDKQRKISEGLLRKVYKSELQRLISLYSKEQI
jgi:hypothetical protein